MYSFSRPAAGRQQGRLFYRALSGLLGSAFTNFFPTKPALPRASNHPLRAHEIGDGQLTLGLVGQMVFASTTSYSGQDHLLRGLHRFGLPDFGFHIIGLNAVRADRHRLQIIIVVCA